MSVTLTGDETKAELTRICEENDIEITAAKPTNQVLIDLIKASPDYEELDPTEDLPKLEDVEPNEIPGEVVDTNGEVLVKTTSKLDDMIADNERMVLVTVTDHDNSQSIEDDQENRLFQASWGNMLCPVRRESVLVNGQEQYISRGMLKHMNTIKIPIFTKGANNTVKTTFKNRFSISELSGWTEEQLEALKSTQAGRLVNG